MSYRTFSLDFAFHQQQRGPPQHIPVGVVHIGTHNHIDKTILIFKGDEVKPLGCRRSLMRRFLC